MREFKFRVWDIGENEMFYDDGIWYINPYDKLIRVTGGDKVDYWCGYAEEDEEFVLMQYTGIKDMCGQEIYEGDIVVDTKTGEKYNVIYDEYKFKCEGYFNSSTDYGNIAFSEGEFIVIGNIYENRN